MTDHRQHRSCGTALVALVLAGLSGCGGYGSRDRVPVQGTVTLDGAPVDGGVIVFVPAAGDQSQRPQVGAEIVGGKYVLEAGKGPLPGAYRVEITWKKKTGRKVSAPGDPGNQIDETIQVIPAQYNTKSTLTADIKPAANTVPFELKTR